MHKLMAENPENITNNKHLIAIKQLTTKICQKIGRDNFAYLLLFIAAMMYPLCFVYVSQNNYSVVQANLVRGVTIFVTHYFLARHLGIDLDFKGVKNNKYLLIRNTIMVINQLAYTAMHYIVPLPVINILNISGSIFAFVCDYLLYGTKIDKMQIPGIIIGFLGVIVTALGELFMSIINPNYESHSQFQNYMFDDIRIKLLCSVLYILVSFLWGYSLVIQKEIKNVMGLKISYHSGVQFIMVMSLLYPVTVTNPISFYEFLKGCAISGLMMSAVQILFTTAFNTTENTGILTMLTTMTILPSYIVSLYSYEQSLNPFCLIGLFMLGWGLYRTVRYGENQTH